MTTYTSIQNIIILYQIVALDILTCRSKSQAFSNLAKLIQFLLHPGPIYKSGAYEPTVATAQVGSKKRSANIILKYNILNKLFYGIDESDLLRSVNYLRTEWNWFFSMKFWVPCSCYKSADKKDRQNDDIWEFESTRQLPLISMPNQK